MIRVSGYSNLQLIYQSSRTLAYSARREADDERVVLRQLRPDISDPELIGRYRRELELLEQIDSEFVIRGLDLIEEFNTPVLVTEWIGGTSLENLTREHRLSVREVITIALSLTGGLDDLHAQGIIHKDINPGNVVYNPSTGEIRIIDFSLASHGPMTLAPEPPSVLEGTLPYVAPEQTGRLNRSIDYRADFYSLGATLFELLAGRPPFVSDDSLELVYHHLATPAPALPSLDDRIPVGLSDIVAKLLKKMPEDRYQSAYAIRQDLIRCQEFLDDPDASHRSFEVALDDIPEQLNISERLLEREQQLAELTACVEEAAGGGSIVAVCRGDAGTGKSSIVRELQKEVARHEGLLVTARHNHLSPAQPYGGLSTAASDLVRQLLAKPDIDGLRRRLSNALAGNTRILLQLAPELKLLLTDDALQGEEIDPPAAEARGRLIRALTAVVTTICGEGRPLVLSIENLHWIDQASLELFEPLVTQQQIPHFMLVCTIRPRDLARNSEIRQSVDRISQGTPDIRLMRMGNLSARSIATLISESIYRPFEETLKLAEVVHNKTGGNPLAVREFLAAMARENILYFDREHREWTCELERAAQLPPTENVSRLLAEKIEDLEPATSNVLKIASCIGERFDLETIQSVSGLSLSETSARLLHAVREGYLINKPAEGHYSPGFKFAHERIQQAAYTLLTSSQRRRIHTSIGQTFLESSQSEEGEKIFEIVNQLNNSFESPDPTAVDRSRLAELNIAAGHKAREAAAFQSAFKYFRTAIALHGQNIWTQYEQSLALHLAAAEAAYLCGDLQQLDVLAERTLEHTRSSLDEARVLEIRLRALVAFNDLDRALALGNEVLAKLGIRVTKRLRSLQGSMLAAGVLLGTLRMRESDVTNARVMTDPSRLMAMRILMILCQAGYLNGSDSTGVYILKMTQLSLRHGMAPESSFAYPMFGALLISWLGTIEKGYRLGMLAAGNLDENNRELHCKTTLLVHNFIRFWKHPLKESLEPLNEAYRTGMDTGDIEFALIAAITGSANSFLLGHDLGSIDSNLGRFNQKAGEFNQTPILSLGSIYQQAARNLMTPHAAPWFLEGDIYSENELLQFHEDSGDESSVANLYIIKLFIAVVFDHKRHALDFSLEARSKLTSVMSSPVVPFFIVYECLARIGAIEDSHSFAERFRHRLRIHANLRLLRKWAHHAPQNIMPGFRLIEAELARLRGDLPAALDAFDDAISLAQEHGYLKEYALANERCGRFHLGSGKRELALFYLRQARAGYARWGAMAKVRVLDTEFVEIAENENLERRRDKFSSATIGTGLAAPAFRSYGNSLDLGSVIKASQVLSGEIILDSLLERLMQVALENAGAHSASLVLADGEELTLEITTRYDGHAAQHYRASIPISEASNVPISVVQYVARTREDLVLNDALNEDIFTQDGYITSHQPKSILCIPILAKSHLTGVLYIENRQTTLAFTQDRVAILKLLASQSAIAIENAKLYQQLNDSRDKYLSLYQNAVEGIFELDRNGQLTNINPAAAQLLGFKTPEAAMKVPGLDVASRFIDGVDGDRLREILAEERRVVGYELQIRREDDEALWVALSAQAFGDPRTEDYRIEGSIIDITERKLREDAEQATRIAQAATESKSQFLANMSHEIRTPMNAITGYTDLALKTELNDQQTAYLETIRNSSNHLLRVVNDILDLSKVESGKLELQHVPFRLEDIFVDLQNLFGLDASERGLSLNVPPRERLRQHAFVGDPARIGQVLINLVSNALKFTEQGSIDVEYSLANLQDDRVCINFTVTDTGLGIEADELDFIFESFAQGTTSSPNAGTGLGLAISRSLVELMEGHIHAVSEKGRGSSFYFSVVVDRFEAPELPAPNRRRDQPTRLEGQRLLLVEDNQINQDLAREVLSRAGLHVDVAGNGRDALERLAEHDYFAVLMDLRMPVMGGLEAIRRIRMNPACEGLPVIALSAGVLKEEVEAALSAGFDYYLSKPVDFSELLDLLNHIGNFVPGETTERDDVKPGPLPGSMPRPSPNEPPVQTSDETAAIGAIDGVDFGRALRNHNNDTALLARLLEEFTNIYSHADHEITTLVDAGDMSGAERLAHNIAGVAGSFGATRLMDVARATEHRLIAGERPQEELTLFSEELARFITASEQFRELVAAGKTATG